MNISNLHRVNELVTRREQIASVRDLHTDGMLVVENEEGREISLDLTKDEIQSILNQRINDINTNLINLGVSLTPTSPRAS